MEIGRFNKYIRGGGEEGRETGQKSAQMTEMMNMDTVDTQLVCVLLLCIITQVRLARMIDIDVLSVKRQVISLASKVIPLLFSVLCSGVCEHTFFSTDDDHHHDGWVRDIPVVHQKRL